MTQYENEIESLITFEDLIDCPIKDRIATTFWNITIADMSRVLYGALPDSSKIAFASYDDFADFPI